MCSCSVTSTSLVQVDTWFTTEGQSSSSPGELGAHESTTAASLHSFCKADTIRQVPSVALCSCQVPNSTPSHLCVSPGIHCHVLGVLP